MLLLHVIGAAIAGALFVYLLYAMLVPEKLG